LQFRAAIRHKLGVMCSTGKNGSRFMIWSLLFSQKSFWFGFKYLEREWELCSVASCALEVCATRFFSSGIGVVGLSSGDYGEFNTCIVSLYSLLSF
jgi:hypothetical protein